MFAKLYAKYFGCRIMNFFNKIRPGNLSDISFSFNKKGKWVEWF